MSAAMRADPAAIVQQGLLLRQRGDNSGASRAFGDALARAPGHWPALLERGILRLDTGDNAGALKDLRACVQLAPAQARAWLYLGNAENAAGDADAAMGSFQKALEIEPCFAQAHYNRGVIHFHAGRLEAAVDAYRAAVAYQPGFALAHSNLGVALEAMGDTPAAFAAYDAAILADHNHPSAHWNKALALLRNGRFAEGWRLYEWRWLAGQATPYRQFRGRPLWLGGRNLAGRSILLHAEQGLGDTIQFARYAPLLAAQGAHVVLEVFQPLVALCKDLPGVARVIGAGEALPATEFHCPLMSLPLALGTTMETIPAEVPYLAEPEDRRAPWTARLGERPRRRIAFAWKGSPKHEADRLRSVPLEVFAALFSKAAEFVCLQRDISQAEAAILASYPAIRHFGAALADFSDTAAVLANCDLVISVDTALAHLAGAMAKPTWLLLPRRAEWRWLKQGETSAWYPTMRLFRAEKEADWPTVISNVAAALQ
jgi:tetratricopeptide (TPR) repeat protein